MPAYKGKFMPNNPHKYKGNPANIVYRSRWELKLMADLDKHPDVLEWSSEEIVVPYISPMDNKIHRYFVDFWVKKKNYSDSKVEVVLIEVKPKGQCVPPKVQSGKPTKRYLNEVHTWGVNSAKWKAATNYAKDRGWKFIIMTEDDLGISF
jgi:hypothetical protein